MFRIFSARVINEYSQRTKSQKRQWKKTIGKTTSKPKKEKEKETLNLWHVYLHLRKITEIET